MKVEKEERKEDVPTMESFHGKERHGKQYQLYNNSQQQCHSFKQSIFTTSSPTVSTNSNTTIILQKAIQLMNTSPTDLMSMLQQQPWKLRTRDMAVQEILRERREAIETGKLKGRRLFEPIQRGTTILDDGLNGNDIGQESEVRSLSFDYSEDETDSPPPSSSLPCLSCDSRDRIQEVKEEEAKDVCNAEERVSDRRSDDGGRYIILLGVIAIALVLFAIYKSWVRRFEDAEVILVPT